LSLFSLMQEKTLGFKNHFTLPNQLLNYITSPVIVIEGKNTAEKTYEINIQFNKKNIATKQIRPGEYKITLPPELLLPLFKNNPSVDITITPGAHTTLDDKINVTDIYLGHFLDPATTMPVTMTGAFCKQNKSTTTCQINVPATTKVIELPVLYYKNLLDIKINGKKVPYYSVVYHGYLLAGITPLAGQMNHIDIRFTGLSWANYISRIAWFIFGLLAIKLIYEKSRSASPKK
jgi:hypothetical protein